MRVLYFARLDLQAHEHAGVAKKIQAQVEAFKELGCSTDLVHGNWRGIFKDGGSPLVSYENQGALQRRLHYYRDVYRDLPKVLNPADYDLLYIRYPLSSPWFVGCLRSFKRQNPKLRIVIEIPTFPYEQEVHSFSDRINLFLDINSRKRLKRYTDLMVTFCGQTEIFGIPAIGISNGTPLNGIKVYQKSPEDSPEVHLLGVATMAKWHGYDRLIEGMAQYYLNGAKAGVVRFHVVGGGEEKEALAEKAAASNAKEYIHFYGPQSGSALEDSFKRGDIGVGSLGMHRIGLTKGSVLKVREFCARGLPFILGYEDETFTDEFPYSLRFPADESPIDVQRIVEFFKELQRTHPHFQQDIRTFAEENLSWKAQLVKVLS